MKILHKCASFWLISFIILFSALLIFPGVFQSHSAHGLEAVQGVESQELDELIDSAISLMLDSHPNFLSQIRLVEASRALPAVERGFSGDVELLADLGADVEDGEFKVVPELGLSMSMPLFSRDDAIEHAEKELQFRRMLESDTQEKQKLKEGLVTEFIDNVNTLFELQNIRKGKLRLKETLDERRKQLEDMVRAELTEPQNLWDLDERINEIEVELSNLKYKKILLIEETARNFAGEKWEEMKVLLTEIAEYKE